MFTENEKTADQVRRRSIEAQERAREQREKKEGEVDAELKIAAAKERADYLIKEVKTSKQQMQNIFYNIKQVMAAVQALRAQLQLTTNNNDDSIPSIKKDQKTVDDLKKKISLYQNEIIKMKDDLIREEMNSLKNGIGTGLSSAELQQMAEKNVDLMLEALKTD